nr:hypothetical protein [Tanacetum cinerariifolium]
FGLKCGLGVAQAHGHHAGGILLIQLLLGQLVAEQAAVDKLFFSGHGAGRRAAGREAGRARRQVLAERGGPGKGTHGWHRAGPVGIPFDIDNAT